MRRRVPPAAERMLAAVLGDGEWTESVLGDLHEEYLQLASRSPLHAKLWYWHQAVRLAARGAVRSARRRLPHSNRIPIQPKPSGDSLMRTLGFEVRHACRSILKRPALSATVVATIALGIGANAAVFSMVDALVLRPFTMRDVDRVAMMSYATEDDINRREGFSPANFIDVAEHPGPFDKVGAFEFWTANLVGADEPETVLGFYVSATFFQIMGVQPVAGRDFLPEEETVGRHRRIVLGHGLWQRRFASDGSIVGRAIEVDGAQYEVVGIAPPGFDFPMGAQLWAPLAFDAATAANRGAHYITAIGRLAPGKTLDDAKAEMAVFGERLARDHAETNRGRVLRVYSLGKGMMDLGVGPILSMWQAAAVFILLIACANVASLLLARGAERQREMAVRLAIGASRARVVRESLVESAILALAAVPAALAVAWVGLKLIVTYMPPKIASFVAGWYEMDVDLRLVLFSSALALVSAVVFGLVPAIQLSRSRLTETLKEGGRGATAGAARLRLRRGLVVGEIALALPLLVAAALSVLTVNRFLNGPQGFDPNGVLTMQLRLPDARYSTDEARRLFVDRVVDRLRAMPGVQAAAAANVIPSSNNNRGRSIEIDGKPNPEPANQPSVDYRTVTTDQFVALGIPIHSGRSFTSGDREGTQPVAIISESLARQYFPGEDPLGKRIRHENEPWLTIVGTCGDVIHNWFGRRNYPTLYRPFHQAPSSTMALIVRTSGDPSALAVNARAAVRAVDPSQPVFDVQPLRKSLRERTIGLHYVGGVMFVFGGLALLLAIVGVYGVVAYMVAQRTHEIGLRMALGATREDVLRLTVAQSGRLTFIGVAAGIVLSIALGRFIEAGLVGVASSDARVTATLAAVLIVAALTAGYLPARRAASIDPSVALRE